MSKVMFVRPAPSIAGWALKLPGFESLLRGSSAVTPPPPPPGPSDASEEDSRPPLETAVRVTCRIGNPANLV